MRQRIFRMLGVLFLVLAIGFGGWYAYAQHQYAAEAAAFDALADLVATPVPSGAADETDQPGQTAAPDPALVRYQQLAAQNTDLVGWVQIPDTKLNYPVMQRDNAYYLSHAFDQSKSKSGTPFLDEACDLADDTMPQIVYGHHMRNGSMFAGLVKYADQSYWQAHPDILFDTLDARRTYEIFAAFDMQVLQKGAAGFRIYDPVRLTDADAFDRYCEEVTALSAYDTGIRPAYGDRLLVLITCSYQAEDGRFVVVAREKRASV